MAAYSNPLVPGSPFAGAFSLPKKRKVFFSFHFDDIMRVNNVRQAWKIDHPNAPEMRSFYDSSLWESRKLDGPDALKRLIREGVSNTSAVCVLVGTDAWTRRWVRYEIARALIDNRGLLGVHLNNINHHVTRLPHPLGENPFHYLGVAKLQPNVLLPAKYYIYEYTLGGWVPYHDHTDPISLPAYLADPGVGRVMPLSATLSLYDFALHDGHRNVGAWIDHAAIAVGR